MRNLFSILLMMIVTVGILFHDAEARRFGGGRSFGMQRSSSNFSRVQSPAQLSQPATAAGNKWLGPIAGLAAGGLLAYLFMGHGLGSGILSWLAIAGIGFMLWNLFRNKLQPAVSANQYNQMSGTNVHDLNSRFTANRGNATTMPAGFDATEFLRDAKVQFIRLQAAYDAKNLNDLREFTTPEVFGEIQLQLQERGDELNQTEVVSLNAELLDAATEFETTIASINFSGMIRENANQPAAAFNEIWHFKKDKSAFKWMVSGLQQ